MLGTFPWYLHLKCQRCWWLNIPVFSAARQKNFMSRWNDRKLDRFRGKRKLGLRQFNLVLCIPFSTNWKCIWQWLASLARYSVISGYIKPCKEKKTTEFQVFNFMFMQTIDFSSVKENYRALRLELEIWTAMKEKTSLTFLPEKFSYIKKKPWQGWVWRSETWGLV